MVEGACGPLSPSGAEPLRQRGTLSQEALGEEDSTPTLCMGVTGNKVTCFLRGSRLHLCITEGLHSIPSRVRGACSVVCALWP